MFYVIYIAVIVFALYLIFHDRPKGDGARRKPQARVSWRPEAPQAPARPQPQAPQRPEPRVSPTPRPLEPAPRPRVAEPQPQPQVTQPKVAQPRPARPARPLAPTVDPFATGRERSLSWGYLSSLEYDEGCGWGVGPDMDTMHTEITGMRYHCSLADVGPVNGFVKPEPDNPHDPEAQVVVRADGKVLGYIPKVALPEYANFNRRGMTCPFAGYVKVSRQGYLWADILVALPTNRSFAESALTAYLEQARQGEA